MTTDLQMFSWSFVNCIAATIGCVEMLISNQKLMSPLRLQRDNRNNSRTEPVGSRSCCTFAEPCDLRTWSCWSSSEKCISHPWPNHSVYFWASLWKKWKHLTTFIFETLFLMHGVHSKSAKNTRKAHTLWVKAKRKVLKTWNVYQPETHSRVIFNSQYKVLLHLPPCSRYLMTT